jgi:phosphoadenosine phosphosulfate reductase
MSVPEHVQHTLKVLQQAVALGSVTLASSLGAEDQVLTDLIVRHDLNIDLFAIDTGRLPAETLATLAQTQSHYQSTNPRFAIRVLTPEAQAVSAYVQDHGANAFYESVDLRKACCHIRKVEPLQRALKGYAAWITGQRREQASTRQELAEHEFDHANGLAKFNPLAAWTTEQVWDYLRQHQVPVNALHARGYPSIGCEPCTRAIKPGEDIRAGRWWWETRDGVECGLHAINLSTVK